ncbi:ATP-binding protein [Asticcacaulis sp. BYS171W]|uniref:histidine kinase n=1 Tax=Asticcacaulis aquaticus TaxID=2984212 RepID=A0ABT5HVZ6_9CAUL|nr:ATP-binding protein [Asticcacaulis aquaticus]MDC7684112.1 ATP-binding protein [Asticcacaulis aquaticus]
MDHTTLSVDFLRGKGELASLMRAFDWSRTAIGPAHRWPQSLKTAVGIMLTSRQPIWIGWGPELIYLYNDAYKSIIGGKHPEALGKPTREVWPEIWDYMTPLLAEALTGGEGTYVESQLLIMERNGYPEETHYTFSYSPIPDDTGGVGGMICANTDDTQRVIGERQLAFLSALSARTGTARSLGEVYHGVTVAVAENGRDLPFALFYVAGPEGFTLAAHSGMAPDHPSLAPDTWPLDKALADQTGQVVDLSAFAAMPTGDWSRAPSQAAVLPIAGSGEASGGVWVVGLNPFRLYDEGYRNCLHLAAGQIAAALTHVHTLEAERKRAEALAELDRAKTAFFSNISHEFRTPLTLLLGPVEDALADAATIPANRVRMEVAHRNALRLLKLVNSLLDFARIEAGRVTAAYVPTDLAAFTAELASGFRSMMDKAGLDYVVDCPPLGDTAFVDRDMWEKIVLNLLSNAFKYTLEGRVGVLLHQDGDHAVLRVSDTGVGMADSDLPHVFERFHRIEGAAGRTHEGSGIGLALVQELVRLHGGDVAVESVSGKGSTFTVRLPLGRGHLSDAQIGTTPEARDHDARRETFMDDAISAIRPHAPPESLVPESMVSESMVPEPMVPGTRIVLADDNADMRGYVERLLSAHHAVEAVADGEAAWAAIRRDPPALVLTDVMMPRLDGFGLLARLRADEATQHIPVVMLSARAGEEARVEGLDAGVDDYLIKPFSARELLARVNSQLKMVALRQEGERRVTRVLESLEDGVVVLQGDWRVTYLNQAARTTFAQEGLDPDGVEGRSYWDAFGDVRGTVIGDHLEATMYRRTTEVFEAFYPRWSRWFNVRVFPVEDGGLTIYFQEITAEKTAHAALRDSEERWRGLTETMPQLVWMTAADGPCIFLNAQWTTYTGQPLDDLRGYRWLDCLHPDDRSGTQTAWTRAVAGAHQFDTEFRIRRADGVYRWFKTRGVPVRDEAGAVGRWYGTCTDIQDTVEAREKAEAANIAKSEFLANMSHEIRTPLNAIVGLTSIMLQYRTDPDRQGKYLLTMKDSAEALMELINDVLDFAKIEADRLELYYGDCHLHQVLAECLSVISVKAQEKGLEVTLTDDFEPGTVFHADGLRVRQIVTNLLSNAVKFTAEGAISLHLGGVPQGDGTTRVRIAVRDTGIGIAPDKIEHIFDKFTQEDSSITRKFGGTGLGLAISRRLAEAMGGRIQVESVAGEGALFTLELPMRRVQAPTTAGAPCPPDGEACPQKARILLVEDYPPNILVATTLLRSLGYTVEVAENGEAAVVAWEEGHFDLILMDIQMPDIDGFEATYRIRRREKALGRDRCPIIVMTAHALNGYREKCLAADMDDYVAKPFSLEDLSLKLSDILSARTGGGPDAS